MGGRVYDPTLGRFLQADPFIQAPKDSQSYNRFAYVRNNPMSMTDPSGYSWISDKLKSVAGIIAAAVVAYYCPSCSAYILGAVQGGVDAFVNGGNVVTGALFGAFTSGIGKADWYKGLNKIGRIAVNYGISSVQNKYESSRGQDDIDAATAEQIVGATHSGITGGKFANGAASKASTELYSSMNPRLRQRAINKRISVETSGWWSNHVYDIKGQICTTDQIGCNDELADRVFAHVDRNDVPFFGDDNAQGAMLLIPHIMDLSANPGIEGALARYLGPQPITHRSFPETRTSRNETLPGHFFHYGDVTHRVYFEGNTLYYQLVGAGEGAGLINNVMGTELFLGGVRDVVNQYGL